MCIKITSYKIEKTYIYGKIKARKALMTGVTASRNCETRKGIHRKGGNAYDSIRSSIYLYWDISIDDVLWKLACSGYRLSR